MKQAREKTNDFREMADCNAEEGGCNSTDDGVKYRLFRLELAVYRLIGVIIGFLLAHFVLGPLIFG